MQSINFSTGFKEYAVNGDENNVIRVNVSDLNMLKRYEDAQVKINALSDKFKDIDKPTPEQLVEADEEVRELLNYVFGSDVCTPAFGKALTSITLKDLLIAGNKMPSSCSQSKDFTFSGFDFGISPPSQNHIALSTASCILSCGMLSKFTYRHFRHT